MGGSRRDMWTQRATSVGELWAEGKREWALDKGEKTRERGRGVRKWEARGSEEGKRKGEARECGAGKLWCKRREVWRRSVEGARKREARGGRARTRCGKRGVPEREKSGSAARALEELRGQRRPLENSGQHWERQ